MIPKSLPDNLSLSGELFRRVLFDYCEKVSPAIITIYLDEFIFHCCEIRFIRYAQFMQKKPVYMRWVNPDFPMQKTCNCRKFASRHAHVFNKLEKKLKIC